MDRTEKMPIWVYLAFSSISTRKGALLLLRACAVFTVYCTPWSTLFPGRYWVAQFFMIEDWSWVAMMVPVTIWYWLSLKWIDDNSGWSVEGQENQ